MKKFVASLAASEGLLLNIDTHSHEEVGRQGRVGICGGMNNVAKGLLQRFISRPIDAERRAS